MTSPGLLTIGALAQATGIRVSAIRYYDERGIVSAISRSGGQRRFSSDAVERVRFICRARDAGMSLADIKAILDDSAGSWPDNVLDHVAALRRRRAEIDAVIVDLEEVARCGCVSVPDCPRFADG